MSTATLTPHQLRVRSLLLRAAVEHWPAARLDAALATSQRLDKGQRCGAGWIAAGKQCHAGRKELTPAGGSVTPPAPKPVDWKRRAAIGAGVAAGALAVGLPAAAFAVSGTAQGRRTTRAVEGLAHSAATGLENWRSMPGAAAVTEPLRMGLEAGAAGAAFGRGARSRVESWRYAPGFAAEASRLGGKKVETAEARRAYIARMQEAWGQQRKQPTQAQLATRGRQVARELQKAERLSRQAATRQRAARRAARIARGGTPFRSSPTPLEAFTRRGLANPSPGLRGQVERAAASGVAASLHQLQRSGRGLGRRRPRFYA